MRTWIVVFVLMYSSLVLAQKNPRHPFSSLHADSVVIYDFNARNEDDVDASIIDKKEHLLREFKKSKRLGIDSANELTRRVENKRSYGGYVADCFEPHLGIVYYKQSMPVAYINVCIDCNRLEGNFKLPAQDQGVAKSEEGYKYYIRRGMSKRFRIYLNALLKKYNFSHQGQAVPAFY